MSSSLGQVSPASLSSTSRSRALSTSSAHLSSPAFYSVSFFHSSLLNPENRICKPSGSGSKMGIRYRTHHVPAIRSYMDKPPPGAVVEFLGNVQTKLPIVGLLSRLISTEGGVGSDRIRFSEFCRRVERNISPQTVVSMAEFEEKFGKMARSQVVLLWCWVAAVGGGLLKSEGIMLSARRMRASMDMEYELDQFDLLLEDAIKKRPKTWQATIQAVPIKLRAEKALEAIIACCVGSQEVEETDFPLLAQILSGVFADVEYDDAMALVQNALQVQA